MSPPPNNRR